MMKEKNIIQGIIRKDERILHRFYTKHHGLVFHFLYRQIRDRETCEELVQDTFLECIEGLRNFRGESSLRTYLLTIARYKAIDYIKRKKIKKILFSALPEGMVEGIVKIFMDDSIEQKEMASRIDRVISQLPNDYQVILRLKYMDGRRVKEIASRLALPFKATESLLFRARTAFIRVYKSTA